MSFYKTGSPEYREFEARIPQLETEDIDKINRLFPAFIFRRRKTKELWTTCCRKHIKLSEERTATDAMQWIMNHELHTPEPIESMYWRRPRNWPECDRTVTCPICGVMAKVKDVGKCGEMKNLYRYRRPVIWKNREDGLWAICYNAEKGYAKDKDLTLKPFVEEIAAYRFHAGKVQHRERNYWANGCYTGMEETEKPEGKRHWVDSPYTGSKEYGRGYDEIDKKEAIAESEYRYCQLGRVNSDSIRTAAVACWYPRQVEMLIKLGMGDAVELAADRNEKNSSVIHWEAERPKDLLGMDFKRAQEIAQRGGFELLKTLKRMPGIKIEDADLLTSYVRPKRQLELKAAAKKHGHELKTLVRYLLDKAENMKANMGNVCGLFKDYIDAAQEIGYDLRNPLIFMPRDLARKHDEATDAYKAILRERKELKAAEMEQRYAKSIRERAKRYEFGFRGMKIIMPRSALEICEEGRILRHCVAGYAERHIKGKLTILFLRRESEPGKPLVTIEMEGKTMAQIHGYKNELETCEDNPGRVDPRELYAEFLETWMKWLENGSQRNEDGSPKLPRTLKGDIKDAGTECTDGAA